MPCCLRNFRPSSCRPFNRFQSAASAGIKLLRSFFLLRFSFGWFREAFIDHDYTEKAFDDHPALWAPLLAGGEFGAGYPPTILTAPLNSTKNRLFKAGQMPYPRNSVPDGLRLIPLAVKMHPMRAGIKGYVAGMAALLALASLMGCGSDPMPVSDEPEKDYKEMLTRAQERKDSKTAHIKVQTAVQDFQMKYGRLPTNLFEVLRFGMIGALPPTPEGVEYAYDPTLGNVSLRKVQETKKPEVQAPIPFEN